MILVTGGTGFLGSHLLKALTASGHEVRCIYRDRILKYVPLEVAKFIDWERVDILDISALNDVMQDVDQVFHCAGMVSFDRHNRKMMHHVNVEGTANVVNSCIMNGVKKLVHVSSVAALGRTITKKSIDESCMWEDSPKNTAYAKSKHEAEMEVWRGMGEGLNAVIVNPTIVIGSSLNWDEGSPNLFKNLYEGFNWYTRGINGYVNATDVANAMIRLMESDIHDERFILNGDNWSYQQLFFTMKKYLEINSTLKYASPWMSEAIWRLERIKEFFTGKSPLVTREMAITANLQVHYDSSKIKRFLPDFTFTPLEETIAEACTSFLASEDRDKKEDRKSKEISNNKYMV